MITKSRFASITATIIEVIDCRSFSERAITFLCLAGNVINRLANWTERLTTWTWLTNYRPQWICEVKKLIFISVIFFLSIKRQLMSQTYSSVLLLYTELIHKIRFTYSRIDMVVKMIACASTRQIYDLYYSKYAYGNFHNNSKCDNNFENFMK